MNEETAIENPGARELETAGLHADNRPGRRAWLRFRRNRPAWLSLGFLILLSLVLLVWPWLGNYEPDQLSDAQFEAPSAEHWFGTDVHGRDLFSRVVFGARISLLVGAVGALVSLFIGVFWGAVAALAGGRIDGFMMRFVDILYSLPSIIFVIVLITTLEGLFQDWLSRTFSSAWAGRARMIFLFAGLGAVSWLTMARIVRGQVLSLKTRTFVDASRVLGASPWRILLMDILPNVRGVVLVYLTLTVPAVILYESFLSYLGLGIQPPQASLGSLIAEGAHHINPIHVYWWLIAFPSIALTSTLLALNFIGDGLRDAFDPKTFDPQTR